MQDLQGPALVAEALAKLDQLHQQEAWARVESYAAGHRPVALTLDDRSASRSRTKKLILRWSSAAAAVLIIAGVGILLPWARRNHVPATAAAPILAHDVLPGGNKAILTLSGGRQVILDSATEDTVLTEGAAIVAGAKGKLAYNPGNQADAPAVYNTLTTPRGGQYQLSLPDGSRVWLNAESSITYPTAFTGKDRKVSVTGESYFEIAKNAYQPFSVEEKGMTIAVLGTGFNVNGYDDEQFSKSTLVEGKVKINYEKVGALLEPGMQAQVYRGPNPDNQVPAIKVGPADVEQAIAWKNGLFAFTDADPPTVMRQLSCWYNVDVKYDGTLPTDKYQFNGKIGKSLTLDQVLKILTKT